MHEVNLIVEIQCVRPPWGKINPFSKYTDSRYRVYVNDDLLTERTWLWNDSVTINENIWINAENIKDHTLVIEPVTHIPEQAKFTLSSLSIPNVPAEIFRINDLQVNFTLR